MDENMSSGLFDFFVSTDFDNQVSKLQISFDTIMNEETKD